MMERGEISSEPETESGAILASTSLDHPISAGEGDMPRSSHTKKVLPGVEEDAFFGEDSDENEDGEEDDMSDS